MRERPFENKVFTTSIWFAILILVYGIVYRIVIEDYFVALIDMVGLAISFLILYLNRRTRGNRYLMLTFILIIVSFNVFYWFAKGGVNGNGLMLFTTIVIAMIVVTDRWLNRLTIFLIILEATLIVLDKYFRHWSVWGENQNLHLDFIILSVLLIYMIWYLKKNYTNQQREMKKFTRSLRELHRLNLSKTTDLEEILNDYLITTSDILRLKYGSVIEMGEKYSFTNNVEIQHGDLKSEDSNYSKIRDLLIQEIKSTKKSIYYINGAGNFSHELDLSRHPMSFIGTPIMLDGEIYGVLSFYSNRIRKRKFEEFEIELIELMGLNISHLLGLRIWKVNQKDTQVALLASENKFKGIFNSANTGISVSDKNGKIMISNPALQRLIGCEESDLINTYFYAYSHPDDLEEDLRLYEELIMGKLSHYQLEKRLINTTDQVIYINMTVSLTESDEDNEQFVITIFDDITSRKLAEKKVTLLNNQLGEQVEKLELANNELESFSYSVSHDLRAPLRAIDGFSKIVIEDYHDQLDEEAKRLLSVISSNSKKMSTLIDDLLAFSRISRKAIEFSIIDVESIVEEIIIELNFDKKMFKISSLPKVKGERTLLKQVYSNLMNNAVKFSANVKKPSISIGAKDKGSSYEFFVKDNGVGFDMRYYDKLFGVFQRLHTDEEFKGTGVGLAIVEKVISKHHGKIWAESEVNRGTTFYFNIPKNENS